MGLTVYNLGILECKTLPPGDYFHLVHFQPSWNSSIPHHKVIRNSFVQQWQVKLAKKVDNLVMGVRGAPKSVADWERDHGVCLDPGSGTPLSSNEMTNLVSLPHPQDFWSCIHTQRDWHCRITSPISNLNIFLLYKLVFSTTTLWPLKQIHVL